MTEARKTKLAWLKRNEEKRTTDEEDISQ